MSARYHCDGRRTALQVRRAPSRYATNSATHRRSLQCRRPILEGDPGASRSSVRSARKLFGRMQCPGYAARAANDLQQWRSITAAVPISRFIRRFGIAIGPNAAHFGIHHGCPRWRWKAWLSRIQPRGYVFCRIAGHATRVRYRKVALIL